LSTLAKHRRLGIGALVVSAGLGLAVAVGPAAGARQSACAADYSYAGLQSSVAVAGIEATVTAMAPPQVAWGHIGGWVGVGGPGMGPNGTDAWIQVGLSSFANDRTSRIYYEIALPGGTLRYVEIDTNVAVGEPHRLAVRESPSAPGWWRVIVDDRPVSAAVHLPGSHGRWKAQAFGESWNGGHAVCNAFDYSFAGVQVAQAGSWIAMRAASLLQDPAYHVVRRSLAAFRARFVG
jgi:hypothetical protein